MSEYQYYEFQAIDRPLSAADREALRALSTRARITASSLTNHYEWGDFKGNPGNLMARWFDLHLYLANWGARRLMMRLPRRFVDRTGLDAFLLDVDWVKVWEEGENLIIDIYRDEVDQDYDDWDDWDDGSGWLAALAPLRADVLSGDPRMFYLLWLTAVEDNALDEHETEPLAGIGPLTGALEGFAEFFGIDRDLVRAAAEKPEGADDTASPAATRDALAGIPEHEKTEFLMRVVEGDPRVPAALAARAGAVRSVLPADFRTAGELRARATTLQRERNRVEAERREAERRRRAEEAQRARTKRLDAVKKRGTCVWREIEAEIGRRTASGYDRAAGLLFDLEAIAAEQGARADFVRRLKAIHERHARKKSFIERLKGLETDCGR